MYEMLIGVTPFFNKNRNILLEKIKSSKVVFPDRAKYKIDYSDDFYDLIIQLLNKDKKSRLGHVNDLQDILNHPVFKDIDIEAVKNLTFPAPFKPPISEKFNETEIAKYFNSETGNAVKDTYISKAIQNEIK